MAVTCHQTSSQYVTNSSVVSFPFCKGLGTNSSVVLFPFCKGLGTNSSVVLFPFARDWELIPV